MSSGAFFGASHFFRIPLVDIARKLDYSEDNIYILEGDIKKLQNEFPKIYENLISCNHNSDSRTPLMYGQDLVASWLIEDTFKEILNRDGLTVKLNGSDKNRKILGSSSVKGISDFEVIYLGKSRKMELMNEYKNFWIPNKALHLRDNKFVKLNNEQSLLLAVSMATSKFTIFDFKENINHKYIKSHRPYGYKPAYELAINESMFAAATSKNIRDRIKGLLIK